MVSALVIVVLGAEPAFVPDGEVDGVAIAKREVPGSPFPELRLVTTTSRASLEALCAEAYGQGRYDPTEPDLKARTLLEEDAGVRRMWEQIAPAVVSPRAYVLHQTIERGQGTCAMRYQAISDTRAPVQPGVVRMTKLRGSWVFDAVEGGKVRITYTIFSDPAGSVPAFLVRGPQRAAALTWLKRVIDRAAGK